MGPGVQAGPPFRQQHGALAAKAKNYRTERHRSFWTHPPVGREDRVAQLRVPGFPAAPTGSLCRHGVRGISAHSRRRLPLVGGGARPGGASPHGGDPVLGQRRPGSTPGSPGKGNGVVAPNHPAPATAGHARGPRPSLPDPAIHPPPHDGAMDSCAPTCSWIPCNPNWQPMQTPCPADFSPSPATSASGWKCPPAWRCIASRILPSRPAPSALTSCSNCISLRPPAKCKPTLLVTSPVQIF